MLYPYRREILASGIGARLHSPEDAAAWVKDSIRVDNARNPQGLRIPPFAVWRSRMADTKSRDIFFVALCRSLGFPARINPVTAAVQFRSASSEWNDVDFESGAGETPKEGRLILKYDGNGAVKTPEYFRHFTLSAVSSDGLSLCEFDEFEPLRRQYSLPEGYYMLCSGMRMADGSVRAHVEMFPVFPERSTVKPLILRASGDKPQVIGAMDAEMGFLAEGSGAQQSILSATGRGYFLICVTGSNDEPSLHLRRQLEENADALNSWGRKVLILGGIRPEGLANVIYGTDVDDKVAGMLREGTESVRNSLPVTALCDSFGRIIYYSEGYDTSLGTRLATILPQL